MMKKLFTICSIFVLFTISNFAQNQPGKKISLEFDYAQFAYDSTSNYIELYYTFDPNTMPLYSNNGVKYVDGILKIDFTDTVTKKIVFDKSWQMKSAVKYDSTERRYQSLVGEIPILIKSGDYIFHLSGRDKNDSTFKKNYSEHIKIKPFIRNKITVSDIQLASQIIQGSQNKKSIFYKNSYEVIPLPTTLYNEKTPVLFYYCEMYNLDSTIDSNPFKFGIFLYDSKGHLKMNKVRDITHSVNSRVEVGVVPINKYPTDTYTLIVTLIDSTENYGVSSTKKFFVYNPSIAINDSTSSLTSKAMSSEFAVMSEEELDDLFAKSKYIATNREIDQYEKLKNVEGKREFLYNFWQSRDSNPATPQNEFYKEYLNRIKISNERYSTIQRKGWLTDRGRVYLIYGEPSEIERYPNQNNSKPYEIWHYNDLQGGVEFDFGDLTGFSDYILLNSTARGEIQDYNWQSRIQQN